MKPFSTSFVFTFSALCTSVFSLNILLSSTDSWVEKSARYLYPALVEAGHNVVFVGSLNPTAGRHETTDPSADGVSKESEKNKRFNSQESQPEFGHFRHLEDTNQQYYQAVKKLNALSRGAKNVISQAESSAYDANVLEKTAGLVRNRAYGQDPLNPDFWYVDSTPLQALTVAFDVILPKHKSGFVPDLVLLGSSKGLSLSCQQPESHSMIDLIDLATLEDELEAIKLLAQTKAYPVVSVSSGDSFRVYYENERFFNVEAPSYKQSFKQNSISHTTQFVNSRVLELIQKVIPHMKKGQALNVDLPPMNSVLSMCSTDGNAGPSFVQMQSSTKSGNFLGQVVAVPVVSIQDDMVVSKDEAFYKISESFSVPQKMSALEVSRIHHSFLNSRDSAKQGSEPLENTTEGLQDAEASCNAEKFAELRRCKITLSLDNLVGGKKVGKDALDALRHLYI